jgi:ribosomal protein S18 acetylase RimI-like enzyme
MPVDLIPFEQDELEAYLEQLQVHYTADKIAAGNVSPENADELIRKEIENLLPQGLSTPHHAFFKICNPDHGVKIGILWIFYDPRERRKMAFIYDLEIDEAYRRQGYASQAMLAVEDMLRAKGAQNIGLHVFGFNTGAQALYRKLGYQVTNIQMAKQI